MRAMRLGDFVGILPVCGLLAATSSAQFFQTAADFAAGDAATGVALADFDDDGDLDIAVANRDGDNVVVLANVNGVFNTQLDQVAFANISRPVALLAANVVGEDDPDLLVLLLGADQVAVLPNIGGAFGAPQTHAIGDAATAFALGDLNGDMLPDVVTSNEQADTLTVLLGDPNTVFAAGVAVPVELPAMRTEPRGLVLADFDGDMNLDVAVALEAQNQVGVLLGNGDGTFGELMRFDTGADPRDVAAADLNGDGALDLVSANAVGDSITVLLGVGDGTFADGGDFAAGNFSAALVIGDIDGDGFNDVATANGEGDSISVLLGMGDGTFGTARETDSGNFPTDLALGDVNGDGDVDIVTSNQEGDTASVLVATEAPDDGLDDDMDGGMMMPCGGASCGPMGLAPLAYTLLGLLSLKRSRRR